MDKPKKNFYTGSQDLVFSAYEQKGDYHAESTDNG